MEVDQERLDHGSLPGAGTEGIGGVSIENGTGGIATAARGKPAGGPSGANTATIVWKEKNAW